MRASSSQISFPYKWLKPTIFLRPLTTTALSSPPLQKQQNEEEEELDTVTDPSYWAHRIHSLCTSDVDSALLLLDRLRLLQGYRPTSATLSAIIQSLCAAGRFVEAHRRLSLLLSSHWLPDDRTASALIACLLRSRRTPHLTLHFIHQLAHQNPAFVPSLTNYNRLIDQFCSLSQLSEARELLGSMLSKGHRPNAVSYTTLINGYARIGLLDDALKLFDEMCQSGVSPNSLTLSVLIKGVLRKRRVQEGKELMLRLWAKMEEEKHGDPSVRSAAFANLIDSLCREGFFHEVFRIAEEMPQGKWVREEFAYGQMTDLLCRAGRHHGASRIVYIMRKRGFVPSLVSYNSIVHGLIKEKGCMRAYQ